MSALHLRTFFSSIKNNLWIAILIVLNQIVYAENKVDVYQYSVEVKAGVYEPLQYESSSKINALLFVQHEKTDDKSEGYIMGLQSIKASIYNGRTDDKAEEKNIDQTNEIIEKPFYVSYNEHGQFQGIQFLADDEEWSKNVKLSIGSALQFNSTLIKQTRPNNAFYTNENTIHGYCRVSEDFKTISDLDNAEKIVKITKNYIPKYCGEYPREVFKIKFDQCFRPITDDNISSVNKVLEVHVKGEIAKLMKYESHEIEAHMPYLHKSDALMIRTKQTLMYSDTMEEEKFPSSLFDKSWLTKDAIYNGTLTYITDGSRKDITQGRRTFKNSNNTKIMELLQKSYDHMKGDRFSKIDPQLIGGDSINSILDTLIFFDQKSMQEIWSKLIEEEETDKTKFMKKAFLDILCYVGTEASTTVIRDVVQSGSISESMATDVIAQFPQYISEPKETLLHNMEVLLNLNTTISHEIRKASILGFASLLFKVYEIHPIRSIPPNLEKYLQYFNCKLQEAIQNNDNEMILVYIMAFQNVKIGKIERFLWPILRKEIPIKEDNDRIRVATAFAIFDGINNDHELVHDIYLPIFTDENEYVPLRTVAFLRLMYVTQLSNQKGPMQMYWKFIEEANPTIKNLHSSKIVTYTNFGTPCRQVIREMYEKIVKFVEPGTVNYSLPSVRFVDFAIDKYAYGEAMIEYILKTTENTGLTDIGAFLYNIADGRRPGPFVQLYWMFEELDEIFLDGLRYFLNDQNLLEAIDKQKKTKEGSDKNANLILIPYYGFQATQVYYYKKNSSDESKKNFWKQFLDKLNLPTIFYSEFKESTSGTDVGTSDAFRHHEPTLFSYKLNLNASLEESTIHLKLQSLIDIWSYGSYDLSIYNAIVDIFHTVKRSTSVDIAALLDFDIFYDLNTKSLKIHAPKLTDSAYSVAKMLTYSKVQTIIDDNNKLANHPDCNESVTVTKGDNARKSYTSSFESNITNTKYSMDIYDCETGFDPDVDNNEWLEAKTNPDRNNIFGPEIENMLIAKHKFVIDIMSPKPGMCGILRDFKSIFTNDSLYVEYKLNESL